MKVTLLCVGRARESDASRLHDRYAGRLRRLGVDYRTDHVPDVASGSRYSDDHVRERETAALLERFERQPDSGDLLVLDSRGELLDSETLARRLEPRRNRSSTFVIGGPLGHHASMRSRAGWVWSLSPLTFPHELVRALVAEQLYRAATIHRGLPYHK